MKYLDCRTFGLRYICVEVHNTVAWDLGNLPPQVPSTLDLDDTLHIDTIIPSTIFTQGLAKRLTGCATLVS